MIERSFIEICQLIEDGDIDRIYTKSRDGYEYANLYTIQSYLKGYQYTEEINPKKKTSLNTPFDLTPDKLKKLNTKKHDLAELAQENIDDIISKHIDPITGKEKEIKPPTEQQKSFYKQMKNKVVVSKMEHTTEQKKYDIELLDGEWYIFKCGNEHATGYYHKSIGKFRNEIEGTAISVESCTDIEKLETVSSDEIEQKKDDIEEIDTELLETQTEFYLGNKLNEVIRRLNNKEWLYELYQMRCRAWRNQ